MGEAGNGGGLDEAGNEGGTDDHTGQTPQLDRIQLETCSEEDDCQAESAKTAREDWIQLVPNVARVAVAWDCTCRSRDCTSGEPLKILLIVKIM